MGSSPARGVTRQADLASARRAGGSGRPAGPGVAGGLAHLISELQGYGLRTEVPMERRQGGAGPADAGMLWIDGVAATVPTGASYAQASPYVMRAEDDGWGIYRDGRRLA